MKERSMTRHSSVSFGLRTRLVALAALACVAAAAATASAVVNVHVPSLSVDPGDTVTVNLITDQTLAGLGVYGIEYTLTFSPSVVSNALPQSTGLVTTWGAPFTNVTSNSVLLAAAGATPVSSGNTLLHAVRLVIAPGAPNGTTPLTLTRIKFNEGSPAATTDGGSLTIGNVAVDEGALAGLRLEPVRPNPARGSARFAITVPAGRAHDPVSLEVFSPAGRRVRTIVSGALGAGEHAFAWDGRDASGALARPGVYLVRLETAGRWISRRFAWLR
jgi:hypothetical protein